MREWSGKRLSAFVVLCIILNTIGKHFAVAYSLPVWMDSFGTVLCAYALGPLCGAIVGVSVNIISYFSEPVYMIYALTSVMIGLIVGWSARKKYLETLFGILSTDCLVTAASVLISTPLNIFFFGGYTGNTWGDGVIDFLLENGVLPIFCYIAGEYYIDFIDKLLTLLSLYVFIRIVRMLRGERKRHTFVSLSVLLPVLLALSFLLSSAGGIKAAAAERTETDYNSWLQTIYNQESGLPGGIANDIAQTENGALWVGTYGGLYRYSGTDFRWMNTFDSVKNVNALYVDDEGRLWIGTNDSGVSICIDNEISNVLDEDGGLPSNSVKCITMDSNGNYFVGTTSSLAIVTLSGGIQVSEEIAAVSYTWSLSSDTKGRTAAVTNDGALFLLEGPRILRKILCETEGNIFTSCVFGSDGFLYVGTSGSEIDVYRVANNSLVKMRRIETGDLSYVNDLDFLPDGELVISAYNGIGYVDQNDEVEILRAPKFSSSVGHMITDYQGNIWFSSSRLGLLKLSESPFTEVNVKAGLAEIPVNTIAKWKNLYCFGTDSGLELVTSDLNNSIENDLTDALSGIRIRCLRCDDQGNLWICTSGQGIWQIASDETVTRYDSTNGALGDWHRSVIFLSDGTTAVSGDAGVTFIRNGVVTDTTTEQDGLLNTKVLCLTETPDHAVLAGTDGGGIALIRSGKVERILDREDGLGSKVILRIAEDPEGEGYFVVTSNSLCFMDRNYHAQVLNDFPYYNNYDVIAGEDGDLFVLGSAGIYVVSRDALVAGEELKYTLLDSQKGLRTSLTANAWNYKDDDGMLFLSGDNGVTVVDMSRYSVSYRSYRMDLSAVTVDDDIYQAELGDTITIPRGARRIVFSPEIMNYSTSDPRISLYLEGFDSAPKVMLLSEMEDAAYTNLPAGDYVFRMDILDEDGGLVAENAYSIVKEKEIYDEPWFLAYVILVFVLTIIYVTWLVFRTQIRRTLQLQRKELELAQKQIEMGNEAILTIARTVDAKDANTSQHSQRVSDYSVMIARKLGLPDSECEELRRTALLHDIGKIGIPDKVLNKPGRLTDEEYALMKSHVVRGAKILKDFTSMEHIVEGAEFHHERWDGRGYVAGLKGEQIPLFARIIGIADAFDAMTSNRVYRGQMNFDYAVGEIKKGAGSQFDPHIAEVFLSLIEDGSIRVEDIYPQKNDDTAQAPAIGKEESV